jgi:hypothetical protein
MRILQTIYEFINKESGTINGLYHVELDNGSKHYFLRNNGSVGAICYYCGRPVTECISLVRIDVRLA